MPIPLIDLTPLSEQYIEESWSLFNSCGDNHQWKNEPVDSVFFRRCTVCGGAEGIKF